MIIKAPQPMAFLVPRPKIFFAGSIEMGKAEHWQKLLAEDIDHRNKALYVMDPRRDDWDSSWVQNINNTQFYNQVTWELENIEEADLVVFYFDKDTKSPITLLELGLVAGRKQKAIVFCPDGFWRKGNVDIVCERYGIPMAKHYEALVSYINSTFWRNYGDCE